MSLQPLSAIFQLYSCGQFKKQTTENQNNEQHGPTKLDVCFYFSNVYSNIQIGQKKQVLRAILKITLYSYNIQY
jgi:hypothetical protein